MVLVGKLDYNIAEYTFSQSTLEQVRIKTVDNLLVLICLFYKETKSVIYSILNISLHVQVFSLYSKTTRDMTKNASLEGIPGLRDYL